MQSLSASSSLSPMIDSDLLSTFQPSKIFIKHSINSPLITSITYDNTGHYLLSSGTDESIQLYDVSKGRHLKSTYSKKYGVHLAQFTNSNHGHGGHGSCLFASTKENDTLRLLSLADNAFIRYFKGHTGQVLSLSNGNTPSANDNFYSSSLDGTVRCWDIRSPNCATILSTTNSSTPNNGCLMCVDPSNSVIAVFELNTFDLKLYALNMFPAGLIVKNNLKTYFNDASDIAEVSKIKFTADNKYILLNSSSTSSNAHLVIDSYKLKVIALLTGQKKFCGREYTDIGNLSNTPDGRFVIGGSGDGSILIWDLKPLGGMVNDGFDVVVDNALEVEPIKKIVNPQIHSKKYIPRMVSFNPKLGMFATADTEVLFWTKELE